jgi:F-type H+-transporting ATPase subunit gamma
MITKKELEIEIQNLEGLSGMVQAFEEIAASRIMHSRQSVLINRNFLAEIDEIFKEVIFAYKKNSESLIKLGKNKNAKDLSFLNKNGKTLYMLISANTGLYGNIVKRTFDLFTQNSKSDNSDRLIIGRLGLTMWQQTKNKDKFYYFDFPDQTVNEDELKKILDFIIQYKKIIIFYGKFQNLVTQEATYSDITGNSYDNQEGKATDIKYVFEPSLEKILEFFEKQIFASIFEQTVRESQLAKIAARLTTLDSATQNIAKKLETVSFERSTTTHRQLNKKQLETFNSRVLWGKI